MFSWLETTPLADWVALSLWAYPSLLSVHIVGLAVVVGIFAMRDLRLLGVIEGLEPMAFIALGRLAWLGFALNALSGFLLFTSQATIFSQSVPFLSKISFVGAGMVLAVMLQARLGVTAVGTGAALTGIPTATRLLAMASLACWLGAIIAGRLIAYL